MPRRIMKSPEQFRKETKESAAAKQKAKANMYLTGGQAKLDKNNNNRIDAQDFKILKAEKAKGRGQGLQDEKMKPGKMMKAKRGKSVLLEKGISKTFKGYSKPFEGPQSKGRVATIVAVKPGAKIKGQRKKFRSMEEMRRAKGFKPGESASSFNRRRAALASAKQVAKSTKIGKIVLPIAAAGVAAQQYLKSKMKKKDKKMGGGMMQKYSKGSQKKLMTSKERAEYVKKAKVSLGATAESLMDKSQPKKRDRLFSKHGKMGGGMMQKPMGYKTGVSVEKYSPGTEGKIQKAANERLRDIKRNKRTEKNPRASGSAKKAAKKQTAFYQSGATDQMGGPFKKSISKYAVGGDAKRKPTPGPRAGTGRLPSKKKSIIITKGGMYSYERPEIDEKKGRHYRQHKSYDASPRLISDAKGKTMSLRSMNVGGSVTVKTKLGRNKPTKMY